MTYQQTLDYLYKQLPMFHRIGAAAYKADLNNTIAICKILGNPEKKFKSIHVAGTNGKGSSSHMLAAAFQQAGYKTGLYTSPHLIDFRERIRINGKMISKKYVSDFVEKYKSDFDNIQPSFFEWTVGLAFDFFAAQKVDIAIVEVGLGGRLDSTNVITPLVSLITNISFDHTNLLGNTLKKIATEKAGIIKKNIPVVISQHQTEIATVFKNKARRENAPIVFADKEYKLFSYTWDDNRLFVSYECKRENSIHNYCLDLTGSYQLKNLAGVLEVLQIARAKGFKKVTAQTNYKALQSVKKLTSLMGRWQIIRQQPLTIVDTGHNEEGIKEVVNNIHQQKYNHLHIVLGMVNDKDISAVLKLLPKKAKYYFTKASVPRALSEKELNKQANLFHLKGKTYSTVKEALNAATNAAAAKDLIFIGGSTFVVADVLSNN